MGCIIKWIFLFLVGLFFLGSYITIKEKYFPEPEIEIQEQYVQLGETYELGGMGVTVNEIGLTEERNEFAEHDRVLKVSYTVKNDTESSQNRHTLPIVNEKGEELYEYPMITENPDYIDNGATVTFNDYYELPEKPQKYLIKFYSDERNLVGLPFKQ